jgi:hypothetical protein
VGPSVNAAKPPHGSLNPSWSAYADKFGTSQRNKKVMELAYYGLWRPTKITFWANSENGRSQFLGYQSRCGSRYVRPATPSQCVDVLVSPFSKPASNTRFLRAV